MTAAQLALPFPLGLPGFGPPLMAHAPVVSARLLAGLSASENIGAVFMASKSLATSKAVRLMRTANQQASILLDRGLYAGRNRSYRHTLSTDWIDYQHATLGLPWALTDSWYVSDSALASLDDLIMQAIKLGPRVILVLPLAITWVTTHIDLLVERIAAAGIPVGIILESLADPIAQPGVISGLLRIFNAGVPVLVLRSDVAAIGSLAFGASAAAIGTSSKLRHLYPVTPDSPDRKFYGPQPSAVVPATLSYKYLTIIEREVQHNPTLAVWKCHCSICIGRAIGWIPRANVPADAAFEHSIASLSIVARTVMAYSVAAQRQQAWRDACAFAQIAHDEIERPTGTTWRPNAALRLWQRETQLVGSSR